MRIKKIENYKIDCELFKRNLIAETQILEKWFTKNYFKSELMNAGAEIEFLILDEEYQLTPHNIFLLKN